MGSWYTKVEIKMNTDKQFVYRKFHGMCVWGGGDLASWGRGGLCGPPAMIASPGGSVPEYLRKPIATRDLPGGGGRVGYASLSPVMFYMSLTGQQFFNHVGTFWLEEWQS